MKKISNSLVTLSSAAILAVYAAGYEKTGPAADRFAAQLAQRRTPVAVKDSAAPVRPPLPAAFDAPAPPPTSKASVAGAPAAADAATVPAAAPAVAAAPELPPTVQPQPATAGDPITSAAAEPAVEPPPPPEPQAQYRDGVYLGWGYSRHGNIQAFVRIEGGRIARAGIERCQTRWSCDLVDHLPGQVVQRQSAEVDYVTGATQSGDAFYGAIVAALAQAK